MCVRGRGVCVWGEVFGEYTVSQVTDVLVPGNAH